MNRIHQSFEIVYFGFDSWRTQQRSAYEFSDQFLTCFFQMEYGIWSLHAAGELWADPRLARRHSILPASATQLLPRAAFALSGLHRPDMLPLPLTSTPDPMEPYGPMELVAKPSTERDAEKSEAEEEKHEDNEGNIENPDENDNQVDFATLGQLIAQLNNRWM